MSERPVIVEQGTIAGNYENKYATRNPIARRMVRGFLESVDELVASVKPASIHEVGCGEGVLTERLRRHADQVRGSDFSAEVIEVARRRLSGPSVDLVVRSVYDLVPAQDSAELVVCCEVLEHLEEPERALEVLRQVADPWLLVSVPREPLWRCLNMARGKYLRALGNTPGHLQHWSRRSFVAMLERFVQVRSVRSPIPWTMVLCSR